MPAYNAEAYIGEAIRSVLAQTLTDWELLIVDDGSTDRTAEIVRGFEDPRIRYLELPHSGYPSAVRNYGLARARGTLLAFLDADDLFLPHKLRNQAAFLQQRPEVGLVAGGFHYLDAQGRVLATITPWTTYPTLGLETWLTSCPVWLLQVLVRREQVEGVAGFDSGLLHCEDYDLLLRLAHAGCRMAWSEEVVCGYRLHQAGRSHQFALRIRDWHRILDKVFSRPDLPPEIRARREEALRVVNREAALRAYAAGDVEQGAAYLSAFLAGLKWTADTAQEVASTLGILASTPVWRMSPVELVDFIWDHLPPEAGPLGPFRRLARARAAREAFFGAWQQGDRPAMRRTFWVVLRNEPRLLDRGMLSIFAEATFGPAIAQRLRKVWRTFRTRPGPNQGLPEG